jgi:serine/threonine protein kinase/predicted Zn-dependent protease
MNPTRCPSCQKDVSDNTNFCNSCGAVLVSSGEIWDESTQTLQIPVQKLKRGELFAGRYEIIESLGQGGMGRVYRVVDLHLDEEVTLKILKPEIAANQKTIERFKTEMKLARKISHKNVNKMFDLGNEEGLFYLTMEYVPGQNIKGLIRQTGQLAARTAVSLAKQVCKGLSEAHHTGIVHRDLKPSNIMIDRDGFVRIMDFGIARSIEAQGITETGVFVGTPEYMSPEQTEDDEIDLRSDIYALGVILYEMVTGRLPFEGETPLKITVKQKTENPRNVRTVNPRIPANLDKIIMKCLEKSKDKRFQAAEELYVELDKLEKDIPSTQKAAVRRKTTSLLDSGIKLRKEWIGLIGLVAIIAAVAAFSFIFKKDRTVTAPGMKMLVVLPFENLGPPEDEYFADGLSDEIMSRLSALNDLGVISRTSAFQYKNTEKTKKDIGKELGVNYVLEGTVRWNRESDGTGRIRVTSQLVRISDDSQLWSERFDRLIKDIFTVQSEIAEQVIKKLDLYILNPDRTALSAQPTNNLKAFDLYLRSKDVAVRAYLGQDLQEYEQTIDLLLEAVEEDPDFTQAFLSLFEIHLHLYTVGIDRSEERLAEIRQALDEAVELDPDLPSVKLAEGIYAMRIFQDFNRALEILESVQKVRPNLSPSYLANIQRLQGKWIDAIANYVRAFRLNPLSASLAHTLGRCYAWIFEYQRSVEWFDRALSISPDLYYSKLGKARLPLLRDGDTQQTRLLLEALPQHVLTEYNWYELELLERNYQEVLDRLRASPYEIFAEAQFYIPKNLAYAAVYSAMNRIELKRSYAERARRELELAISENPEDTRLIAAIGLTYAYLGQSEEAVREGLRAVNLYPISGDAFEGPRYILNLAKIYAVIGERDKSIEQLEILLSIPSGNNYSQALLRIDPIWDSLRINRRFQNLLLEEGQPDFRVIR